MTPFLDEANSFMRYSPGGKEWQRIGDEVATVMKVYAHSNAEDDQVLADTYEEVLESA